jgi:anion-transporting  ArsA/GET3 family ATPase
MSGLSDQLAGIRIVVCAGTGGVGKTTVAATVALGLAADGHRVALVTIDPARRLAEALGMDGLGNDPQPVDLEPFVRSGLSVRGELSAMMLNVKRTFDELVARLAPDRSTLEQILANPIYNQISTAVAGSQEYTAMAKLYELHRARAYDVIVLDTPPSRSAVDFLMAPERLSSFLQGRAVNMFIRPTGTMMRMAGWILAVLRRIVGVGMLEDLTNFFRLLSGLLDGFQERAAEIQSLLVDPATGFLIISSPEREPVEEAVFLGEELARLGMRGRGLVLNRLHPVDPAGSDPEATAARLEPLLGAELAGRAAASHAELQRLARREEDSVERLRVALEDPPTFRLVDRGPDVHDIPGLMSLREELFG